MVERDARVLEESELSEEDDLPSIHCTFAYIFKFCTLRTISVVTVDKAYGLND